MSPEELHDLEARFDKFWEVIRGANLHAGQPRSVESANSVSLAREAFRLASDSGDDHFIFEAWRMLAYTLTANEQYEESIPWYDRIVKRLEEVSDSERGLGTRNPLTGYVAALFHLGRYQEALQVAQKAEQRLVRNKDEAGHARLCTNIANLYHRLDDHMQAYQYHLKAVETFVRLDDKPALAACYLNLGNALSCIDQFEKSDEMYGRSEKLSNELAMTDLWAQASYNRGYLHYLRGRYTDALQSFGRLRQYFERSGSHRHHALCDLDESEIYLQLNLSNDAATLALRAAKQFKKLALAYEEAKATAFYGVALVQLRRFADALDVFRVSQRIFEQEGNTYWTGLLDLYRAEVHFALKRLSDASSLATQSKQLFDQLAIPSKRILSLVLLGRIALALEDLERAEACTTEVFALIKDTEVPLLLFPHYILCGEVAERNLKPDMAQKYYELAAQDLDLHQTRLQHDELRVTFFQERYQAYETLLRLSLDRQISPGDSAGLASAFAWCERAKSRGLIELLSHHLPSVHAHAEQSLLLKINRLREELNIHYAMSQPEIRPIPSVSNFETIAVKEQELARSLREVSVIDPEYASLQKVSIASLEEIQCSIPEGTTLVEYSNIREETLAFVISRKDARIIRRLCPVSHSLRLQTRLGFQLENFLLGEDYVESHSSQMLESTNRHLQELYQSLIGPIASLIRTPHVTIIPHGALHFLPFHAFYDGTEYLIDQFEISYAPSSSVLKYCLEKHEVRDATALLVGVSDESTPFVSDEIVELKGIIPNARILQDGSATRDAFATAAASASLLHIATHAIFRHDNPMFSSFKLSDGWLTALDLFSMKCETNLVTLSGCKSGVSHVTGNDDIMGLMRGFLYAGARSLLLSLWNVNDQSTAALMGYFYRSWGQGATKSKALQTAMQALRHERPNPFHWAPFRLIGKF